MVIPGRVHNGVVVLEGGSALPDSTAVSIVYPAAVSAKPKTQKKRIQLPLVHTGEPGTLHLTNEHIAEILDEENM